jgi:hypothetical protein
MNLKEASSLLLMYFKYGYFLRWSKLFTYIIKRKTISIKHSHSATLYLPEKYLTYIYSWKLRRNEILNIKLTFGLERSSEIKVVMTIIIVSVLLLIYLFILKVWVKS